jgi:hypothetical protein
VCHWQILSHSSVELVQSFPPSLTRLGACASFSLSEEVCVALRAHKELYSIFFRSRDASSAELRRLMQLVAGDAQESKQTQKKKSWCLDCQVEEQSASSAGIGTALDLPSELLRILKTQKLSSLTSLSVRSQPHHIGSVLWPQLVALDSSLQTLHLRCARSVRSVLMGPVFDVMWVTIWYVSWCVLYLVGR